MTDMKKVVINSVKVSLGVILAITLANILQLEFAVSAGIVAILTIQPTKRETMKTAMNRLFAFVIALGISYFCFQIFGFTQTAFLVYMLPYAFICYLKGWTAAIAMNSVLISHFLNFGEMTVTTVLNELLIFAIGVGVGIIMNLHLHKKIAHMEALKDQTDEQIVKILSRMGQRIETKDLSDYNGDCFSILEQIIREAKNIAQENYNNQLSTKDDYDIAYIAMRDKQYEVLYEMYKIVRLLETTPDTASMIATYFKTMSEVFHEDNDGKALMEQFQEMDQYMKSQPLPQTRQEFEDRARLFALMRSIEEFLMIKIQFVEYQNEIVK